jgi:hypothetical protein
MHSLDFSVNEKDDTKRTPLTMACRGGFKPIIITLLNFGARYNEPDDDGLTPFQHLALPHKEPPPQDPELQILRELGAQFRTLFRNQSYSDCQFITETGTVIPGHRVVLMARCPRLHQYVAQEPSGKIHIQSLGFNQQLFVALLEFLYAGAIEFENSELELQFAFQLMAKAQEYQIATLSTYCESTVLHNMDGSTVILVLDVARQHKVTNVEEYCSWFALKNIAQVMVNTNLTQQQILQIVGQVQLSPAPPPLDNFNTTPILTKIDPYGGASSDGYSGLSSSGTVKPPKPKAPKPKKPADGNYGPPGPAPKKQKVAPPTGYVPPSTIPGASPNAGRPKIPAAPSPNQPFDAMAGQTIVAVKKLMKEMKNSPDCIPFLVPVDIEAYNIPDYRYIISRPIDIGTISKKISSKQYKTVKQWAADVRQVWENARIYNAESSPFNMQAVNMATWFEPAYAAMKQQADLPSNYDPALPPKSREWYAEQYSVGLKRYQEATGVILQPASNIPPHVAPQGGAYGAPAPMHNAMPPQQARPPQPAPPRPMAPQSVPQPVARPPQPSPAQPKPQPQQPQQPPKRKADAITPGPYGAPLGSNGMGSVQHAPMHHQMPQQVAQPPVQHQPVAPATLTAEEMEDLSSKLNNLDENQINRVIEILGLQPNANGEYEININELDTRTLRKLQTFVTQELGGAPAAKRPAF